MKRHLHNLLHKLGYDVIRWPAGTTQAADFYGVAEAVRADVVVDIGANIGQFAAALRARGYAGRIVSFEPASGPYDQLRAASQSDRRWEAHQLALGAVRGEAVLTIPSDSSIASLARLNTRGKDHFSDYLRDVREERVRVERLDTVWDESVASQRAMVKIDVQGYEREVLAGATNIARFIVGLQIELSVRGYYDAPAYLQILDALHSDGFEPVLFHPISWHDGVLGEIDVLLVRPRELERSLR